MEIEHLYRLFSEHQTVTTDSRDCPEGSIFFALKGESFDGNRFAETALQKGCSYAVIDEPEYARDERYIVTDDALATLKQLARHHRRQFDIPVIGITGTNGKDNNQRTRGCRAVEEVQVLYTEGNFNNDFGVPKTLLRLRKEPR
jgi:UDP-N-acetylmuramyl pentapeptide synthase